ncbi:MAG: ABC-F family ATP-binding cassette domain-containing protein [Rhizobiaceae bacterium]|jgi:ATP-binding cassette subfamily F protein 3|nr:ABC-F family ATP-binding cassette domain-containing protein [Rhizobiaceae bacterium]
MLTLTDLTLRIAGRPLIEDASLALPPNAKAGLVGRNGTGKTTLFKAITGVLEAESGSVSIPSGARIGQVAQEAPGTEDALIDIVLAADTERAALLARAATETDAHEIAAIQARLTDIGAHSAEARAARILSGLGFDASAQRRPASSFSGGWRMRVALASVLFSAPDLLLLDEPTNYLDLEGTLWLENYLTRYPYSVLMISHDQDLLNKTCQWIVHLEHKQLTLYRGNYDGFARQYAERAAQAEKAREKIAAQRRHMEAFVERFKAKASKARQAQSRIKALARLGDVAPALHEDDLPLNFPELRREIQSPAIAMRGIAAGYGGAPILKRLDLRIDADDRIALLGSNGNGKSTLAKLIAGRLQKEGKVEGEMVRAPDLSVAYFAQHQLDELRPAESAVEHVRRAMPQQPEPKVRAAVARMGLPTEKMDTPAQSLSGGEKARLLLGLATMGGPNLLILDEPTNHLDIGARQALIEALNDYAGAVILISHDRRLIEATADRLWLVKDGAVKPFDGDMEDYRALVLGGDDEPKKADAPSSNSKAEARRDAAQRRAAMAGVKKKINETEALLEKLRKEIQAIEVKLADPALYQKSPAEAARLAQRRAAANGEIDEAEERWLALSEEYEAGISFEPTG